MRKAIPALICAVVAIAMLTACWGAKKDEDEKKVPILLFHHLDENADNEMTVTPGYFEEVIRCLGEAGYTSVGTADLIAYVDGKGELPEKPVMISFDDGYESNITLAAPILEKYGMRATMFVIGVSVGRRSYKDTGEAITPHFTWEQAAQYAHVIEVQSHSYDMHQVSELDGLDCRLGVQQMENEDAAAYGRAFRADFFRSRLEIEEKLKTQVTAFAYPYGQYNLLTEKWLRDLGVRITMTTEQRVNRIVLGEEGSLLLLGRLPIAEGDDVFAVIENAQ